MRCRAKRAGSGVSRTKTEKNRNYRHNGSGTLCDDAQQVQICQIRARSHVSTMVGKTQASSRRGDANSVHAREFHEVMHCDPEVRQSKLYVLFMYIC